MLNENNVRVFLFFFGVYAAVYGPWWLPAVPIVLLSLRFRAWEVPVLGLLVDFLWQPAVVHVPLYFIFSIGIVWAFEPLRRELLMA